MERNEGRGVRGWGMGSWGWKQIDRQRSDTEKGVEKGGGIDGTI